MITIDDERDQMQVLLDRQTEENNELRKRVEQLESTVRTYHRDVDKGQAAVHQIKNEVKRLETENEMMRRGVERMGIDLQAK